MTSREVESVLMIERRGSVVRLIVREGKGNNPSWRAKSMGAIVQSVVRMA